MYFSFILFGMFVMAIGDSNDTLSIWHYNGDILHEARPSSCEVKCHNICQVGIRDRCQRCYRRCWLLIGYKLYSGNVVLSVSSTLKLPFNLYRLNDI